MRVTVTLKKNSGNETHVIHARDELDFSKQITALMEKHGARGFSRQSTVRFTVVR